MILCSLSTGNLEFYCGEGLLYKSLQISYLETNMSMEKEDKCLSIYGSRKHNYFTVASTVATQIPHTVGAAYSLKMEKQDSCAITYFGTSTADFHAAMNFAAVMEVPVIFFCRNNGWAINTPVHEQFGSDGGVVKGKAYGVPSIRIDGNDALAIYNAVHEARKRAIKEQTPVLIEALTYRAGHHTTSDDSTRYRAIDEIERWRGDQNPIKRFRKWIESRGWWKDVAESEYRSSIRKQVAQAIQVAERIEKPPVADMFNDVYDVPPRNLNEQEVFVRKSSRNTEKIILLMFHCKAIFIFYLSHML
ncbi:hypothetical protein L1987_83680 [Smallanthus sonchifolius]|uniref:Uncharacterized protein n=1 Tax=Smallanthus sonchifolius TaxID=185202 RepID=A0ACB8YGU2_9ASTR|nr:hypothetical protein L1987_83680 [Smallanthus sonchifolius]